MPKFILSIEWPDDDKEIRVFSAESREDALDKAFGNPKTLPAEAFDDPESWIFENTVCNMYEHGEIPEVELFEVISEVNGAQERLDAVHKEVADAERVATEKAQRKLDLEEFKRLKKKLEKGG